MADSGRMFWFFGNKNRSWRWRRTSPSKLRNAAPNSLNDTFRSVICHVLLHLRGGFLCTEESHVGGIDQVGHSIQIRESLDRALTIHEVDANVAGSSLGAICRRAS